jgi:hypothetical protein
MMLQSLAAAHLAGDALTREWLGEPWAGIASAAGHARRMLAAGSWDRAPLARLHPLLTDPTSVVVVTGQQPAVGGGPLYTLVKLAHAIVVARRLTAKGVPAVAWFWCASDDHDLGEANHADLIRRDGSIVRVPAELGAGRAALRWRPAAVWWEPLVSRCQAELGGGLGSRWLLERAPLGDEGMGAWLCRMLRDLCAGEPVAACEAHLLRPLWAPRLPAACAAWPVEALAARQRELIAHGYSDPFGPLPRAPLFRETPAGRVPVDGPGTVPADQLSPGAALRPILQQLALPAAASILGNGELAYHAAIGPAYAALGALQPLLVPRCSLTLLPSWAERAADRLGLTPEALADGIAPDRPNPPSSPRLTAVAQAIDQLGDPSDRRIAAAQVRLRRELDRLTDSLARGSRIAAGLPAPGSLSGLLRPRGQRQERTMSLFQAVWEHGPGVMTALIHAADETPPGAHRLVRLAG